jgi:hypothetical protein
MVRVEERVALVERRHAPRVHERLPRAARRTCGRALVIDEVEREQQVGAQGVVRRAARVEPVGHAAGRGVHEVAGEARAQPVGGARPARRGGRVAE